MLLQLPATDGESALISPEWTRALNGLSPMRRGFCVNIGQWSSCWQRSYSQGATSALRELGNSRRVFRSSGLPRVMFSGRTKRPSNIEPKVVVSDASRGSAVCFP